MHVYLADTVLVSVIGHLAVAGIFNYLLLLPVLYSLCLQQAPLLVVVPNWWGDPNIWSWRA